MHTQFDELIVRHLKGTLREDEKQLLAMMLRVPEIQFYLASKIDEQFFDESLKEVGDEETRNQIFRGIQQKLNEQTLQQHTIQEPAEVVQAPWHMSLKVRLIGVAASIALLIYFGMQLTTSSKSGKQPNVVQSNTGKTDGSAALVRHEVNTTGNEKRIQLSDGSMIVLADKTEVTYREPLTGKREIILTGKAYFKVAKDKAKPFTVISGDISTTALGTEFTVTAFENTNQIIVRLYEGKVVVKGVNKLNGKLKKDVYLSSGQAFVYGSQITAKVKTFKLNNADVPEEIMNREALNDNNPSIPQNTEGSWYMFNNQSLGQVLEQLAKMHQVDIVYDKKDLQHVYFTRKYSSTESIEIILKEIATLNNLTVTRKDNMFVISK